MSELNLVRGFGPFCSVQAILKSRDQTGAQTQTLTPSSSLPVIFKSSLMRPLQCSHVQSKKYCVFSSRCLSSDKFKKSTYATVSSSPSEILPRERSSILRKSNTVYWSHDSTLFTGSFIVPGRWRNPVPWCGFQFHQSTWRVDGQVDISRYQRGHFTLEFMHSLNTAFVRMKCPLTLTVKQQTQLSTTGYLLLGSFFYFSYTELMVDNISKKTNKRLIHDLILHIVRREYWCSQVLHGVRGELTGLKATAAVSLCEGHS